VELRTCDETPFGFSWVADEPMTRTSHALLEGGRVWLVDPVDWPDAIERARALGDPAAVLQLLDRHNRDCAAVAARLGVPNLVVPSSVPDSPFEVVDVVRRRRWREVALWWPEERALVVAEALGTNAFFTVGDDAVGVHGLLKVTPPRHLRRFPAEHLLVGHGEGLHGAGTQAAIDRALGRSRARIVPWLLRLPFSLRRGHGGDRTSS
jgi:hypothetical protein